MRPKNLLNLVGDKLHTLPLMVLYLTDGCNSRCVTCDIWRNPRKNMDMALVDAIVDECADLGLRWVLLSGGEAMQHPEWDIIAQKFRDIGVYTMLLTNGLLLRKQIDRVIASVDEVIVSLDGGNAETYQAIRGVDAFDLIIDGMRILREHEIPVVTRTTIQKTNFREISQIIEVSKSVDVSRISFLAVDVSNPFAFGQRFEVDPELVIMPQLDANALNADDIDELATIIDDVELRFADSFASGQLSESPDKLRRILVDYFRAVGGAKDSNYPPPRCNAPHFSVVIEVDGTLRPCYFLPEIGKLQSDGASLRTAMNGDTALALRKAYRLGQRKECSRCVCPLYKGPRALLSM